MWKRALAIALTVLSIGAHAKADVLIGTPTDDPNLQDCVAFGCGVHAQFIFDSSYFAGPISITELQFFNSDAALAGDTFDPGTYTFTLATSVNDYLTPDQVFANNIGPDAQLFTTAVLGSDAIPAVFSFAGAPFTYNPANGDLLLDIAKRGSNNTMSGFTDYNGDQTFKVSRVWSFGDTPVADSVDVNFGPVVDVIGRALPNPVPEPMTLSLTGLGLVGIATRLKRSRKS